MSAITAIEKFVDKGLALFAKEPASRPPAGRIASRRSVSGLSFDGWMPAKDPVARKAGVNLQDYEELLSDAHCGGAVDSRKAATLSQSWFLKMDGVPENDPVAAETVNTFGRLPIAQLISEMLDAPLYGVQDTEVVWPDPRETGRYIMPIDAVGLPAWWLDFTTDGVRMLKTDVAQKIPLPPRKFILLQYKGTIDNPHGQPVLARCYWPVYFKKAAVKLLATALERYGLPWTELKFPHNYDEEMMTKFVARAAEMAQDGVIGMPEEVAMRILSSSAGANGADLFLGTIAWANSEISKAVVGHTGGTDSTPGKLGSEDAAMDVRSDIVQADRELVQSGMNQIIDWIYEINHPNQDTAIRPRFEFFAKQDYDKERVERDKGLHGMGWRPTKKYIVNAYGFEEDDFFLIDNPPVEVIEEDAPLEIAPVAEGDGSSDLRSSVGGSAQVAALQKDYYSGVFPREAALANLEILFGFNREQAELLLPPIPPAPPVDPNAPVVDPAAPPPASFAAPSPTEEEAETMTEEEMTALEEKLAGPILEAVENGENYDEAIERLSTIYPELDGSDIVEGLTHRMFLEALRGENDADA
jgi:phage gp29-like protein